MEDSSEDDSEESSEESSSAMQVALRDKEEALVQSALARIRRAQKKGKREVKLDPEELEALERRRKRMQSASTTKTNRASESSGGSGSGNERRRRSDRQLIMMPIAGEPSSHKKKSKRSEEDYPNPPAAVAPPGMISSGPDGVTYAPLGYYPPQAGGSRSSPTRPRSSTSRDLRGTPPPQYAYPGQSSRHFSDNTRPTSSHSNGVRRPLPDDAEWVPSNSRRSSVSSQTYTLDPFQYQTSPGHPPQILQQYMQTSSSGRRIVSGPAEVAYSSVRRSPPLTTGYPTGARAPTSDPAPARRMEAALPKNQNSSSDEEDESDDLGNGVQVFMQERETERDRSFPNRKPVGGGSSRRKGKGK